MTRKLYFIVLAALVGIALALIGLAVYAQDKPPVMNKNAEITPVPAPASAPPPAMPAETGIKLRDAVLVQAKLVIQLKDAITTYNNLQGSLQAQAKVLDDLKAAALKDAKLDPAKWDVDMDKFLFIPKPAPPAAPLDKPIGPPVEPAKKP